MFITANLNNYKEQLMFLTIYELEADGLLSYAANVEQIRATVYKKKLPQTEKERREEEKWQKELAKWLERL